MGPAVSGAFDKIKEYLYNPLVLMPPWLGIPLILFLAMTDTAMGAMFIEGEERIIYHISKKFLEYKICHMALE